MKIKSEVEVSVSVDVTPEQIVKAISKQMKDKIFKQNVNAHTKFDHEGEVFTGSLGESAFRNYLEARGYKASEDFWTNEEIDFGDKYIIGGRLCDPYDFKIKGNVAGDTHTIDVKTQFTPTLNSFDLNWQVSVPSQTVSKVSSEKSEIDSFVFVFTNAKLSDFLEVIYKASAVRTPEAIVKWIEDDLERASRLFAPLRHEIVGMIGASSFAKIATSFDKNEIFRMNFGQKLSSFKAINPMHRLYLSKLDHINRAIAPKRLDARLKNSIKFKEWFEETFPATGNKYLEMRAGNTSIRLPLSSFIKGVPDATIDAFLQRAINYFESQILA